MERRLADDFDEDAYGIAECLGMTSTHPYKHLSSTGNRIRHTSLELDNENRPADGTSWIQATGNRLHVHDFADSGLIG